MKEFQYPVECDRLDHWSVYSAESEVLWEAASPIFDERDQDAQIGFFFFLLYHTDFAECGLDSLEQIKDRLTQIRDALNEAPENTDEN